MSPHTIASTNLSSDTSPANNKVLHYALWTVQILLGGAFFMAGMMKLGTPASELVANGMAWAGRVSDGLISFIGLAEVAGGLGLILPALTRIAPKLTPLAGAALALVMVLAAGEHGLASEFGALAPNFVLGGLALFVAWGRSTKVVIQPREGGRRWSTTPAS